MRLKNVLGQIEADNANFLYSPLVAVVDNHDLGTRCRRRGVHPIGVQMFGEAEVRTPA